MTTWPSAAATIGAGDGGGDIAPTEGANGLLQDVKIGRDRLFINREFLELLMRPEEPVGPA